MGYTKRRRLELILIMTDINPPRIYFASARAKELANSNNLKEEDFEDYNILKIYKEDVEKKIKQVKRLSVLSIRNRPCECCGKIYFTKAELDTHLKSSKSQLYFTKKEMKEKDIINNRLSNKITELELINNELYKKVDKLNEKIDKYQDMFLDMIEKKKEEEDNHGVVLEDNDVYYTDSESDHE